MCKKERREWRGLTRSPSLDRAKKSAPKVIKIEWCVGKGERCFDLILVLGSYPLFSHALGPSIWYLQFSAPTSIFFPTEKFKKLKTSYLEDSMEDFLGYIING
jgi:hypothetical protein